MSKVLVIHGPNLNLLGTRETEIYGTESLDAINAKLAKMAQEADIDIETFQSNHEGDIVDKIQTAKDKADYIIINPAAFTHYSLAIRDAIASVNVATIEVHLSNIYAREDFRHTSVVSPVAHGIVCGFGAKSYYLALEHIIGADH